MAADGRLQATEMGVTAPDEHMDALRLVPRPVRLAFREIILLRDKWTRGFVRLRDLFTRNKVATELRDEARQILEDEPAP